MRILGIETSCDETAAAIYDGRLGLMAQTMHSQIAQHTPYGGVVPEIASRDHIRYLLPVIQKTLQQAGIDPLSIPKSIEGIAYTAGPGLIGALLVGASLAHSLAMGWALPILEVHHLEAHLMAVMLEHNKPTYPFLALLVSGGHTQLILVKDFRQYEKLGESLDDAAGEAFDKVAKLLELSYPGGPAVAQLALKGHPQRFQFPRPMINRPGLDFSFSGLKTHVMQTFRAHQTDSETDMQQLKADIAYAFEQAVADSLTQKCIRAIKTTQITRLVVAGGVAANQTLRNRLMAGAHKLGITVYFPRPELCTDNAAMVAYTGYLYLKSGLSNKSVGDIQVYPRWSL